MITPLVKGPEMTCPTEAERSFLYAALIARRPAPIAVARPDAGLTPRADRAAMAIGRPRLEAPHADQDVRR